VHSVFLACDDPYQIARLMTEQLGWLLEFATPSDSDDKLACVSLGWAQVRLGTADLPISIPGELVTLDERSQLALQTTCADLDDAQR
jgi:hypothetical protein